MRIKELFESYRVIREILDNLPAGDLTVRVSRAIPAGETISRVEAPRGELFYFIKSDGGENPERGQGPHAQPVQLGVGAGDRAAATSWPTCR